MLCAGQGFVPTFFFSVTASTGACSCSSTRCVRDQGD
jgi:hypothetical protein